MRRWRTDHLAVKPSHQNGSSGAIHTSWRHTVVNSDEIYECTSLRKSNEIHALHIFDHLCTFACHVARQARLFASPLKCWRKPWQHLNSTPLPLNTGHCLVLSAEQVGGPRVVHVHLPACFWLKAMDGACKTFCHRLSIAFMSINISYNS